MIFACYKVVHNKIMAQLEIKKMKQGMSYSCKEKTIILNVFKYFRQQFPEKCVTEIVRRTAKATGCSEKSIFQFRKEEASVEGFREPSKTKIRKNININSRDIKYDSNVRQTIRNIIYDLKYRNIVPSLNTILKQVNADTQMPNFSLMTLRRLLFDMGFCYEKNGNKSILVEKQDTRFVNKDNLPQKSVPNKKAPNNNALNNIVNINLNTNNINLNADTTANLNTNKLVPQMSHNNHSLPTSHIHPMISDQQGHRLMPMHISQPENHMMPHMHTSHTMAPMMLNHRTDLLPPPPPHHMRPPGMDLHLKREMPPWMHHPTHNMVKQQ